MIFVHCEKVPKGRNMIMRVKEFPAKMAFKNDHLSSEISPFIVIKRK